MASLTFARPLAPEDEALAELDRRYAEAFGLEPFLSRSSVSFYVRTGHAFASVRDGEPTGFVLAQAVWNGTRPTVYVNRLVVPDPQDTASREALLEAVTKSAYDAAVYDLQVQVPEADAAAAAALGAKRYRALPERLYARTLGSRGQR